MLRAVLAALILVVSGFAGAANAQAQNAALEDRFGIAALQARQTHNAVEVLKDGEGANRVYIFLPKQPALSGRVPVVFFHHGWQGMNPVNFGALIDHLVLQGQVVIYPVYQQSGETSPQVVLENATAADRSAITLLESLHLQVDPARVLYVGYSMGASISLDIAISPDEYGLPAPRALILLAPGDASAVATGAQARSIIGDLSQLPRTLPIAVMTGEEDTSIGLPTARRIFKRLCRIRADRRVLMVLPGDSEGGAIVHSQHGSPGAPDPRYDFPLEDENFPRIFLRQPSFAASPSLNQLDVYGFWKVIDALVTSLPAGTLPREVFGHGDAAQTYLGAWPDGRPFKLIKIETPCQ